MLWRVRAAGDIFSIKHAGQIRGLDSNGQVELLAMQNVEKNG